LLDEKSRFTFPFTWGINKHGAVLFEDVTFPGGGGLFMGKADPDEDAVRLVAHSGDRLPDGGSLFGFFENVAFNDSGTVLFDTGGFADSDDLLLKSRGTLTKIARGSITSGDPAPNGGTFFNFGPASINNLGQVVFPGSTIGGAGGGLYLYSSGQISALLDSFTPNPPGIGLGAFSSTSLNDNGEVAFFNQTFGLPNSILLLRSGNLTRIVQDGDLAPGGGNFVLPFPGPSFGPALNLQDQTAFSANLSTGGQGVFLYSSGGLTRIAGPGNATPNGGIFDSASFPSINASGEVVFSGTANGEDAGIYAYNGGTLVTVAHKGTQIAPHRELIAAFLPHINAAGTISFTGVLTDGSSVILTATLHKNGPAAQPSNTQALSGAGWGVATKDQLRARFERATYTGVFENPDRKTRNQSKPRLQARP
jgi:hypothetical protein